MIYGTARILFAHIWSLLPGPFLLTRTIGAANSPGENVINNKGDLQHPSIYKPLNQWHTDTDFVSCRWPVNSPQKGPVTRKVFPFDDVIMRHFQSQTMILCCGAAKTSAFVAIYIIHQNDLIFRWIFQTYIYIMIRLCKILLNFWWCWHDTYLLIFQDCHPYTLQQLICRLLYFYLGVSLGCYVALVND